MLWRNRALIASQGKSVASRNALVVAKANLAVHVAAMQAIWARLGGKKAPWGATAVLKKAAKRKPVVQTPPGTEMWR